MASDSDPVRVNGVVDADAPLSSIEAIPATPPEINSIPVPLPSSQVTIPSTEDPGSPIDPSASFKTENNDDRADADGAIIPSSLTPPPSSQAAGIASNLGPATSSYLTSSQRAALFSPPTTVGRVNRPSVAPVPTEYVAPSPQEVRDASADTLRAMMQQSIAENSRLKMEAAHYKLQLNLLSLQAGEDAKRAAVEHDMARREVEALREAENIRQARRELSAATESTRSKYLQIKSLYEDAVEEIDHLERKLKLAKKVIQQQEDEVCRLREDRQQLRTRIRENREHFNMLCSPGGIFHGVLTPKASGSANSQASRGTPKQTPRGSGKTQDPDQRRFDALLQVLSQENNSAPSTPTTSHRAVPRQPPKHTRNVQSLSSLPTTPTKPRGRDSGLLPSVHLAPQTEPPRRYSGRRLLPDSPRHDVEAEERRRSRESTISVHDNDNEELARQALASVQKATSSLSRLSGVAATRGAIDEEEEESDVPQSQASLTASQMLRRDPRQSFEVAAAREGSRSPLEGGKTPGKLLPSLDKNGEKRKFSGMNAGEPRRELLGSPPKKVRVDGLQDPAKVGLGIKYS
ncbi:hypothetical protein jhhlp_002711 [Lomentospora prolificans]|uniref:FAD-dependent oxidoreductase-like enzyme n=1 Tax=Lomentospora prolificans TaxID=41688 RepID=A0A2N3NF11_9PEZI|nr:hypothetical protein jhhlp_002711 [Lomentospora prolificans]